jgi:diacylglycerol kinase (ATP)
LVYNPRAGRFAGKGAGVVERVRAILAAGGRRVEVRPTTGPRTAGGIARAAVADGAGMVVAAGGDGTVNETAEGMLHSGVPLGILPGGTANVLATEMKLGGDLEAAARTLAQSKPYRIGVGRLTAGEASRHFLLMAGIGLDAHIVYRVNTGLKARTGKLAYWVAGWSLVGRALPEFRVTADGRTVSCSFALAARVRNYGGDFEIARETTLFDDDFEVVLFEGDRVARYVKYFAGMATSRLRGMKGVTVLHARELTLSDPGNRRVYIQVDGELAGALPAKIEIVPDALTLMVPPGYAGRAKKQGKVDTA